jgi:hypothetical protein
MRTRISTAAIVLALFGGFSTSASTILIDNFDDGNDTGWTHRDYSTPQTGGPAHFAVSNGAYDLTGTNPVPTGQQGAFGATWDQSSAPLFQNGYLRARLKANSNSLPWLILRHQTNSTSFYLFGIDPSNDPPVFFHNRIDNAQIATGGGFNIPGATVEIGEEWIVEAGAVGNNLSMKIWKPGDPEPAAPQWTKVDSTYPTGVFGVGASHYGPQPPSIVSATFDDIVFRPIPEPSSAALGHMGLICLFAWRRRPIVLTNI